MPLSYEPPPASGALRQGEILANVWEHRTTTTLATSAVAPVKVESYHHPAVIVMSADCDLAWDFEERFQSHGGHAYEPREVNDGAPKVLPYTLSCSLFPETAIRARPGMNSEVFRRIRGNQDERYHYLPAVQAEGFDGTPLALAVIDFKRMIGLSTGGLYDGVMTGDVKRVAVVPPIYLHNLMHRFFSFLSRVGLPD